MRSLLFLVLVGAASAAPNVDTFLSFLTFGDMHIDPLYNTTHCSATESGTYPMRVPATPLVAPFGRYGCDPPMTLLKSMLAEAKRVDPTPEFIFMQGDSTGHRLPNRSMSLQVGAVSPSPSSTFAPHGPFRWQKRLSEPLRLWPRRCSPTCTRP